MKMSHRILVCLLATISKIPDTELSIGSALSLGRALFSMFTNGPFRDWPVMRLTRAFAEFNSLPLALPFSGGCDLAGSSFQLGSVFKLAIIEIARRLFNPTLLASIDLFFSRVPPTQHNIFPPLNLSPRFSLLAALSDLKNKRQTFLYKGDVPNGPIALSPPRAQSIRFCVHAAIVHSPHSIDAWGACSCSSPRQISAQFGPCTRSIDKQQI
ncbi:hypothetical protein C8R45DRAFT_1178485 [Mycena sanguinolenta]|nr:hypothetical protein C8R45DRAFT_1178485 [Mycena sanguinolenta]